VSSQGNGQPLPRAYKVLLSEQDRAWLKNQHLEAIQEGKGQRFLAALRTIYERLRTVPLDFGEPLYRLPALRLLVRQGVVATLVVDYAVHEEQPLVFVRGFKSLS
jgi:hypothetical protein